MSKKIRALIAALPATLFVTFIAALAMEAVFYLLTLWGERQLEFFGILSPAWVSAHKSIPVEIATALSLIGACYVGWRLLQTAVAAELELLGNGASSTIDRDS